MARWLAVLGAVAALVCAALAEPFPVSDQTLHVYRGVWSTAEFERVTFHLFTVEPDSVEVDADGDPDTPETIKRSAYPDTATADRQRLFVDRSAGDRHLEVRLRFETPRDRGGTGTARVGLRSVVLLEAPQLDRETVLDTLAHCDTTAATVRLTWWDVAGQRACTSYLTRPEDLDALIRQQLLTEAAE